MKRFVIYEDLSIKNSTSLKDYSLITRMYKPHVKMCQQKKEHCSDRQSHFSDSYEERLSINELQSIYD